MASMAISLQLKPKPSIRNPIFLHFFSSSTTNPDLTPNDDTSSSPSQSQSLPSFSSVFSDVKANLKNKPSPSQQTQTPSSTEEIRKRLSQFRPNASSPPPPSQHVSFQGLYQKNMLRQGGPATTNTGETRGPNSFEAIKESLKNLRSKTNPGTQSPNSLSRLREGISSNSTVIGGSGILPASIFGREMNKKEGESPEMKTLYMKSYERDDLGKKLRDLRPKDLKGFSIKELNERLVKLVEIDLTEAKTKGAPFSDLRESLVNIEISTKDKDKEKKITARRLDILGHLGQTPSFMLSPPKEHLVEKYFHPDNMSSAEKLKIELQKVRDEFKISETDCGSAQVQVAQLTTKIKHLADVLHKKDKHSRKGLQEMIQRRKKLLKYLRRTDWESYCFVLSKLGLRDNPDYKAK